MADKGTTRKRRGNQTVTAIPGANEDKHPVQPAMVIDAMQPPRYTIDLSLPPDRRYLHIVKDLQDEIRSLPDLFEEIMGDLLPEISFRKIQTGARLLLRRVHSKEQTEELRSISKATGVEMYLLVAFNVLLDLFMGCTSGGARVKDSRGQWKMLHFRTLDWGMDALRKVVIELDFIRETDGPVVASTITYFGFVGVLTGVKKNLSLSLNFRPTHDASTRLTTIRFHTHQLLVLLGFRPSISSILRDCLLRQDSVSHLKDDTFPSTLESIERHMPSQKTTAAYLIFSDGTRTITMEKDHRTAIVRSAEDFIVALNHDEAHETSPLLPKEPWETTSWNEPTGSQSHFASRTTPTPNPHTLNVTGMEDIVAVSIDRKACITRLWQSVTPSPAPHNQSQHPSTSLPLAYTTPQQLSRWLDVYDITNEETHFSTIMDPKAGAILWIRRYMQPIREGGLAST